MVVLDTWIPHWHDTDDTTIVCQPRWKSRRRWPPQRETLRIVVIWAVWVSFCFLDQWLGQVFLPPVWDEEGSLGQQAVRVLRSLRLQERLQERLKFCNGSGMCCTIPSKSSNFKGDFAMSSPCSSQTLCESGDDLDSRIRALVQKRLSAQERAQDTCQVHFFERESAHFYPFLILLTVVLWPIWPLCFQAGTLSPQAAWSARRCLRAGTNTHLGGPSMVNIFGKNWKHLGGVIFIHFAQMMCHLKAIRIQMLSHRGQVLGRHRKTTTSSMWPRQFGGWYAPLICRRLQSLAQALQIWSRVGWSWLDWLDSSNRGPRGRESEGSDTHQWEDMWEGFFMTLQTRWTDLDLQRSTARRVRRFHTSYPAKASAGPN